MFMRNRLARKMAAEMRGATCAGTQTSKAPTLSGPSVTNRYSVLWRAISPNCAPVSLGEQRILVKQVFIYLFM